MLSNGNVVPLTSNTVWLPEYGWYTINGPIELDRDYDNVITLRHPYGWGTTEDKIVSYTLGMQYLSVNDNHLFSYDNEIGAEQLQVLVTFLEDNGLSFIDIIPKPTIYSLTLS